MAQGITGSPGTVANTSVNTKGGFGVWCCDIAFEMAKIQDILEECERAPRSAHSR
jgi:hypothetical protein